MTSPVLFTTTSRIRTSPNSSRRAVEVAKHWCVIANRRSCALHPGLRLELFCDRRRTKQLVCLTPPYRTESQSIGASSQTGDRVRYTLVCVSSYFATEDAPPNGFA